MIKEHDIAHMMAILDDPSSEKPKNALDKHNVPG